MNGTKLGNAAAGWSLPESLQELPAAMAARLMKRLIGPFEGDTVARLKRVRLAIAGADLAAVRAEIHSLKGSSSQMGADAMSSGCAEIEAAIGQVTISELLEGINRLEAGLAVAVRAMHVYAEALEIG